MVGSSARGRGGKYGKPLRGGGKKFSRNLAPLDNDEGGSGISEGMWESQSGKKAAPDSESEEEEDSDEEGELGVGVGGSGGNHGLTREERKAAKQARKDAARARTGGGARPGDSEDEDDDEEDVVGAGDRKGKKAVIVTANLNAPGASVEGGLSRKEREALDAAAAKERYWKLQEAGKTDQAKADLARLAVIKREREEKARQRKAELEEKKAAAEAKAAGGGRKQK